jgi:hypothetical protein
MKSLSGLTACALFAGLASAAAAQDLDAVGDWRDLGHDDVRTYAWDLGAQRRSGDYWIVRAMSSPLHPQDGLEYAILEIRISCGARTYVIERAQEFGSDGRPLSAVQQTSEGVGGPRRCGRPKGARQAFFCRLSAARRKRPRPSPAATPPGWRERPGTMC